MIELAAIAWAVNVGVWLWFANRIWRSRVNKRQRDHAARMRAEDVFTLHPGTKGLITDDPDAPLMWQLPSGRIVYQRYWRRLEGVEAKA